MDAMGKSSGHAGMVFTLALFAAAVITVLRFG
jgi:hypothetical protein